MTAATDAVPAPMPAVHDISMMGLFMQADPIVKAVMILLLIASVACWAIILDRATRIRRARRDASQLQVKIHDSGARSPSTLHGIRGVGGPIIEAGLTEWSDSGGPLAESRGERRERIERAMRAAMVHQVKQLETGLSFLATVGSAGPFIGLFGTVWGIMNSFTAIASSQDTSLAVVAPGIAEALFATALGLVAAIPAVVAYNRLSSGLGKLAHSLSAMVGELSNRLAKTPVAAGLAAAE